MVTQVPIKPEKVMPVYDVCENHLEANFLHMYHIHKTDGSDSSFWKSLFLNDVLQFRDAMSLFLQRDILQSNEMHAIRGLCQAIQAGYKTIEKIKEYHMSYFLDTAKNIWNELINEKT